MATKVRFSTNIKSVPYLIHTGINLTDDTEISKFISSKDYKLYVTESFMERKKIKVTSIDVTEVGANKFMATLMMEGFEEPQVAEIEVFKFSTGKNGGML
jgi:hypothetical protein